MTKKKPRKTNNPNLANNGGPRPNSGRPKIPINWEEFDKLCLIQCTLEEIASWFKCSIDTIEGRCKAEKSVGFSEYFKKNSVGGRISLRRKQFQVANAGNVALLIFLGKQYLGQSDGPKETAPSLNNVDWDQVGESFAKAAEKIATKIPAGFTNG